MEGGGEGDKVRAHPSLCTQPHTLEPPFNEVPRDWENLLVISRACYIENLNFKNFCQNKQNVYYIEVWLMINFQCPAFPDLNNFIFVINNSNKFVYEALVSVQSCT